MSDAGYYLFSPVGGQRGISSGSPESLGTILVGQAAASTAWPANNLALFVPFRVIMPMRIGMMYAINGASVAGNIDLGIYNAQGVKLASNGGLAQAGTSRTQTLNMAAAYRVGPGQYYYMAIALSSTGGFNMRYTPGSIVCQVYGMAQMANAYPLPNNAVFASIADNYFPGFGIFAEEA